ncbi:Hypothetical protein, putative [Bodo saltans]|uniref:Uncharacterized protein n=1 Tax=Bodo saltans TaxID=75058 RepID=A0A0S4JBI4_BODSA|nr:Hypothetical protein, putative [Bodo saltans]|eukprot:CUG87379.1 Hypothetical protein, putative [Bodo saltans]
MFAKESRPVISRKKTITAAPNKVDHIRDGALPESKRCLPESGRFHAVNAPATNHRTDVAPRRTLDLFTPPPPPRASSAIRLRPEQEYRQASPISRDTKRRSVRSINESSVTLSIDDSKENTLRSVPSTLSCASWKRPSSSIFFGGDAPQHERWVGRRPSPQRGSATNRVLEPSEQPNFSVSRTMRNCSPQRDEMRNILRRDSPRAQTPTPRPIALRTKIQPFSFDNMPTPRPTTNPRHVIAVPQPSTVFNDAQQAGLCFWDYKFSCIQKPAPNTLAARRAATPEPRRQLTSNNDSIQRSGRRRIVPPHLLLLE